MEIVKVKTEGKTYEILIQSGLFCRIDKIINEKFKNRKLAIVCDTNVFPLYGKSLSEKLGLADFDVTTIIFSAGEENKNLNTLSYIYEKLAVAGFTRSDTVIALGGGVTGDMAGLAAATFLRGIGFIQIPTTLLAMVDSSIGGKVAVDLPQGKNLIGAFYQPDAVYAAPELLKSLTDRQFSDGMAELIKHGIIKDISLFNRILEIAVAARDNNMCPRDSIDIIDGYIKESCIIKRNIVEQDEHDNGIRQLLNFGHTIGHAIEKIQNFSGLSHGEAISIGMVVMTRITEEMGLTKRGEADKIIKALNLYKLPVSMPEFDFMELMKAIRLDKKSRSGKITIAYIEEIGKGNLFELDQSELEERIHGILNNKVNPVKG